MEPKRDLYKLLSYLANKKFKRGSTILTGWTKGGKGKVFLNPGGGEVANTTVDLAADKGLIDILLDHNNNQVAWLTDKGEKIYNKTVEGLEKNYSADFEIKNLNEEIAKLLSFIA